MTSSESTTNETDEAPLNFIDHLPKYAGLSRELKLSKVLQSMKKEGVDALYVNMLEEISWLLNVKATG